MWLDLTHLALVGSLVSLLEEPDLEGPVVGVFRPDHTEALVPAVGVEAGGEDVVVASPDPRHLVVDEGNLQLRHLDVTYKSSMTSPMAYLGLISG